MANVLDRNFDFATNGTVTAAGLHNLIDETNIYAGLISTQEEKTTVGTSDLLLVADSSSIGSPQIAANRTTVYNLFDDALTGGTYVNAQLSGNLTYGTATGGRTISTGANITNGTISTLIAGTTTSTAAAITNGTITNGTITNGTIATALIPTLTAGTTTGTAGIFTSGTIATLNSTTGTITNLSTTLAGDFTISQGTGTIGTTGATLGTYGGATSVPVLAINAKGQVTSTGTAAITSGLTGFRNRIINGDMRIDQRSSGSSLSFPANTSGYCIDRFKFTTNGSAAATVQRSTTVPTGQGFTNSLLTTITTAEPAVASGNKVTTYYYSLEGFNVSDLGWGTASAQSITISFWVRSSVTGTYSFSVMNTSFARSYNSSYAISAANTWEKKTFTIPGDTGATSIDTTNGNAIQLVFDLGFSTLYETSTANTWLASGAYALSGCVKLSSTLNATWYLTGLQLEAGSTATDFERRPIGTELALCQRYYWKVSTNIGRVVDASNSVQPAIYMKQTMRTAPTLESGATFTVGGGAAGSPIILTGTGATPSPDTVYLYNSSANWTVGQPIQLNGAFYAEL
jgi:hypothetical protein